MKHKSLESALKDKVLSMLHATPNCWAYKTHGGKYQAAGLPDIIGCLDGKFFGIELKRPEDDANTSELQEFMIRRIWRAKGIAFSASTIEEIKEKLGI